MSERLGIINARGVGNIVFDIEIESEFRGRGEIKIVKIDLLYRVYINRCIALIVMSPDYIL